MPWSNRVRITKPKYMKNKTSQSNLIKHVERELHKMVNFKMGMIPENHDNIDLDFLSGETEKKLISNIIQEVEIIFIFS